jgi:hypothetical protein
MSDTLLLIRDGTKLSASDPVSFEAIQAMAHGEQVVAEIRRARNPGHHRKMFAFLKLLLDNQEKYKTIEDILNAVKIGVGHCRWGTVWLRGVPVQVAIPKSISFANMGQAKFETFYNAALDYAVCEIIPGLDKANLERQVLEFLT